MLEPNLAGRRILVVEDVSALVSEIVQQVHDHNGVIIGPVANLEQGLTALQAVRPDACILNIRLGRDTVYPLADELLVRRIPFIFASSERRADIPDRFAAVPLHTKPIEMVKAAAGLIA